MAADYRQLPNAPLPPPPPPPQPPPQQPPPGRPAHLRAPVQNRRYANSRLFIKNNYKFGDELQAWPGPTSYKGDFRCRSKMSPQEQKGGKQKPQQRHAWTAAPTADELLKATTSTLPPPLQSECSPTAINGNMERKKLKRKTNFRLGSDNSERLTTYAYDQRIGEYYRDNDGSGGLANVRRPCTPPEPADIFSHHDKVYEKMADRSMQRSHFTFFGKDVTENAHRTAVYELGTVKNVHNIDSVALTLATCKPLQQITCSMKDYRLPARRIGGTSGSGGSLLPRRTIEPKLRLDSVRDSIHQGFYVSKSETMQNFRRPLCIKPVKQLRRGHMNKAR